MREEVAITSTYMEFVAYGSNYCKKYYLVDYGKALEIYDYKKVT